MEKPLPITGYRSRAINAAVDYAEAVGPVAGPGIRVSDGVGGRIVSLDTRGSAPRAEPWQVRAVPLPGSTDPSIAQWKLRVYLGLCTYNGVNLTALATTGTDAASGLAYVDIPSDESAATSCYIVCAVVNSATSTPSFYVRREASPVGTASSPWRAVAHVDWPASSAPSVTQLDLGVVDISNQGGGVEPGPTPDSVAKYLRGYGAVANQETWNYGDTDSSGKLLYPIFASYRLYWDAENGVLYGYSRTKRYNAVGMLVGVGAEVEDVIFTAVEELP